MSIRSAAPFCLAVVLTVIPLIPSATAQDSLNVTKAGTLSIPWGTPVDVELAHPYAYISAGWGGIGVIDVSNPYDPQLLGTYPLPGWAGDITLSEDNLIVAADTSGFYILDVSDPLSITGLCHCRTGRPVRASDVQNTYAYIIDLRTLHIFDIVNPVLPLLLGSFAGLDVPHAMQVHGDYAFVTENFAQSVHVFNVSNPENPNYVTHYSVGGPAVEISINNDISYVSHSFGGFHAHDISNPEQPVALNQGGYDLRGGAGGMEAVGLHLFAAESYTMGAGGMFGGLQVFDTTDPENLVEVGYYNIHQHAEQIEVYECYAYMTEEYGFSIYDCSDAMPVAPSVSSEIPVMFSLLPPHPNPFNPTTTLTFSLPVAGKVDLKVYDVKGRHIMSGSGATPTTGESVWYPSGIHHLFFDGSGLSSGVYLVQMQAGEFQQTQKLVLLK
jgi:hypothetical protein